MRLIDFFDKGVEQDAKRPFLIEGDRQFSYKEIQETSHRIANALRRRGINAGARIALYSANSAEALTSVIGILRAGCVFAPANVLNPIDDTLHIIRNTEAEALFFSSRYRKDAELLAKACPSLKLLVCIDGEDALGPSLQTLIRSEDSLFPEDPGDGDEDVVTLFNSGGTTGAPKGVMMTNRAWASLIANIRCMAYHEKPVHLVSAPVTHAAGAWVLAMAPMGTTNVILPGFDPEAVMDSIERHRVTHVFLPPTAIYRLLAHPDVRKHDYSSLRYFTYAGAPMSPERAKEAVSVFGPAMTTAFGQTETGLNVTFFSPEEHLRVFESGDDTRLQSCGRASPLMRVEIMNDEGRLLPPGEAGEIVVRGNQLMKGYWNNEEETRRASLFGWHHTGDIGYKDDEGWIFLVDRKREMIISGGLNVFPSAIEKVVISHPAVLDCAVVGAPDADWGEAVTAVIQLREGQQVDVAELRNFCRERLGGVKTPKRFEIWRNLPRSPVGKVLRRKVREAFWQDQARNI